MKTDIRCLTALLGIGGRQKRATASQLSSPISDVASTPTVYDPKDSVIHRVPEEKLAPFVTYGSSCLCSFAQAAKQTSSESWAHAAPPSPRYSKDDFEIVNGFDSQTVMNTIESTIEEINPELRKLNLDIWEHPEVGFKEHYAHDTLTAFMSERGFTVTKHYLGLDTAWRAEYSRGIGGRVIGLQSEMDALPNIGHACGHNLIAISGVAIALALKAALEEHNVSGKIVLLGTPAEESGGGKIKLLEQGAYSDMDVCMMAHPGPGAPRGTRIQPWIAMQSIEVEFFGHSAHAAYAPWEAQNALDAAFLAYSGVSVLRQQMKPNYRVHGIVTGKDWEPNVIPDYSKMRWIVRAPTWGELEVLRSKVIACFEAAAHATSCKLKIEPSVGYKDCRQNSILGDEYIRIARSYFDMNAESTEEIVEASTDFGDISYTLPSIQPVFSVPVQKNGSNHTPQFAESARAPEAHDATIMICKALAMTGVRVLQDDDFYDKVCESFRLSS